MDSSPFHRTRKFEILARLVNFCWFFFKWGLVLGLVAAAVCAVPYFNRHVDDTIRRRVETLFAEHYPDLDVHVQSAELVEGGILIRGLSIVERGADGPRAELAYLDEMLLVCETDLPTLVRSTPAIREIVVRRPTIRNTRRPDGAWSAARLLPLPKFGDQSPEINIEGASLEMFDPLKNPAASLTLREGNLKVILARSANSASAEDAAPGKAADSTSVGNPRPGTASVAIPGAVEAASGQTVLGNKLASAKRPMTIRGSLTGDHLQRIEIEGVLDAATGGAWDFGGKVEGLEISPELTRALPGDLPPQLKLMEALHGQAKGDFHVRYAPSEKQKLTFQVTGQLVRGRIDDPRLPNPLTDLTASFRCDERGFAVYDMKASSGAATLRLDFKRDGYGENRPLVLAAEARHLKIEPQLNPQLLEMLPAAWRDKWFEFAPSGEIDLDVKLAYDGRTWQPDVTVQCQGVDFCYFKFPYRLEHGRGEVTLKHDAAQKSNILKVGVTALSGGEEVGMDGAIHRPGPDWHGQFVVHTRNLPVDKKLLDALPPKPREVVSSLHQTYGNIDLFVKYSRDAIPHAQLQRYIQVKVNNGSIKYERFSYPLNNVRGMLEIMNDDWSFTNFEGTNHTARIRCSGHLKPAAGGSELMLTFTGDDLPLDEELRDALAPAAQRLWSDVRPRGLIRLNAEVRHHLTQNQTRIWVRAEPLGDTASIEPIQFPLRLDNVHGVFTYNNGNGRLEMFDLRAEHGQDMRVSGRGICDVDPRGGWRLKLDNLSAGRIRADRDVLQALPPRLRKAVTKLNVSGPVHMSGGIELVSSGRSEMPLRSSWNLNFDLQQVGLHCGVPVDNINGMVNLTGTCDGQKIASHGELAIDSLTYKDFQFTEVRGPLAISDQQVVFGEWATLEGQAKRQITSRIFGGVALGDGWVTLEEAPRYNLDAKLVAADLARCAQECAPGARRLKGKVEATVNLHGAGAGVNQLLGGGAIRLTDADVYELPVMAQLLKIVSARAPDANAFDKGDIEFTIQGDHVTLQRIDFNGDAISLRGVGGMGFDKSINLEFYTVLGRDEFRIPIVSDVFGGASQGLLKIYVRGTLAHPDVQKQALPVLSESLQQIQAEMQRSRSATSAATTGSRPLPSRGSLVPQRR